MELDEETKTKGLKLKDKLSALKLLLCARSGEELDLKGLLYAALSCIYARDFFQGLNL